MPGSSDSRNRCRRVWLGFGAPPAFTGLAGDVTGGRLHGGWLVLIVVGAVALACAVAALTYLHVGARHLAAGHGHRNHGYRARGLWIHAHRGRSAGRPGGTTLVTHTFCASCGVRLDADASICGNCGRRV